MTKKEALTIALNALKETENYKNGASALYESVVIIEKMIEQLSKPHTSSDEAKSKQAQARKDERAKVLAEVVTPIRAVMDKNPRTADEIFHLAKDMLPADWTIAKTRYLLTHNELGDDVISIDNGRNPHTYHL